MDTYVVVKCVPGAKIQPSLRNGGRRGFLGPAATTVRGWEGRSLGHVNVRLRWRFTAVMEEEKKKQ